MLGNLYEKGLGVKPDINKAIKLYERSAKMMHILKKLNPPIYSNVFDTPAYLAKKRIKYIRASQVATQIIRQATQEYKYRPVWWDDFAKYLPKEILCSPHPHPTFFNEKNPKFVTTFECGPFSFTVSDTDPENFSIGRCSFRNTINSPINCIAQKRGINVSAGFDFTPALIRYIIEKTPKLYWIRSRTSPKQYYRKIAIVGYALNNLSLNADIKTLNEIISSFVKDKLAAY